jgi:hypothetical protein
MKVQMSEELFESEARSTQDLAGFFEYENNTAYFYLYRLGAERKVLDAIHIFTGPHCFSPSDIIVRWDREEKVVGLFIQGVLWAAFQVTPFQKFGGNYARGECPAMPVSMRNRFDLD